MKILVLILVCLGMATAAQYGGDNGQPVPSDPERGRADTTSGLAVGRSDPTTDTIQQQTRPTCGPLGPIWSRFWVRCLFFSWSVCGFGVVPPLPHDITYLVFVPIPVQNDPLHRNPLSRLVSMFLFRLKDLSLSRTLLSSDSFSDSYFDPYYVGR
jgi:hypothetical protein